jgi:hypothetical protein
MRPLALIAGLPRLSATGKSTVDRVLSLPISASHTKGAW